MASITFTDELTNAMHITAMAKVKLCEDGVMKITQCRFNADPIGGKNRFCFAEVTYHNGEKRYVNTCCFDEAFSTPGKTLKPCLNCAEQFMLAQGVRRDAMVAHPQPEKPFYKVDVGATYLICDEYINKENPFTKEEAIAHIMANPNENAKSGAPAFLTEDELAELIGKIENRLAQECRRNEYPSGLNLECTMAVNGLICNEVCGNPDCIPANKRPVTTVVSRSTE